MKKNVIGSRGRFVGLRCERIYRVIGAPLSLCLLLLNVGCSTVRTVYVPGQCLRLPAELLQATPVPYPHLSGKHMLYGEALEWTDALIDALDSANKDKAAVLKIEQQREEAEHAEK
ncbi:Rz1-like lysis system protein LysC [Erwinia persicina]|uniref:Rz1-like lysis system protein LysC n=1 Tax=Erwinia persicina TaxID=55211 RepID=UPI00177C5E17|nr:peptidase [Erwinia persicina]MBD8169531.1 peptidase [Erwinia persicina]